MLLSYLREAEEHERGGVLLGHRDQSVTRVSMAVFPPQLLRQSTACEFDVGSLSVIHAAKDMLDRKLSVGIGTIVGWVHSHPKLGLFLSETDGGTLGAWQQLDPRAVAVVADPYLPGRTSGRLAWWHEPGPGCYLTLDNETRPILTIGQVAAVAEALNRSADSPGRWDIVTARAVMRIIAAPDDGAPAVPSRDRTRASDADGLGTMGQQPRRDQAQQPQTNRGQRSGDDT